MQTSTQTLHNDSRRNHSHNRISFNSSQNHNKINFKKKITSGRFPHPYGCGNQSPSVDPSARVPSGAALGSLMVLNKWAHRAVYSFKTRKKCVGYMWGICGVTKNYKKRAHSLWKCMSRNYNYCFTINNPTLNDKNLLIAAQPIKYLIWGNETGADGTPHYQGLICWRNAKTLAATKRYLPRAHLEVMRGTFEQAAEYCKKDGDFTERGTLPKDPREKGDDERARWESAWALATLGRIADISPQKRLVHYNTLKRIGKDYMAPVVGNGKENGVWLWGESGCGKTTGVLAKFPRAYPKTGDKWFDGLQGETVWYLDDVDPEQSGWLRRLLKLWTGGHAFIGANKGGASSMCAKLVIVTSQYRIDSIWADQESRVAFHRRFIEVEVHEGEPIIWPGCRIDHLTPQDYGLEEEEGSVVSLDLNEE